MAVAATSGSELRQDGVFVGRSRCWFPIVLGPVARRESQLGDSLVITLLHPEAFAQGAVAFLFLGRLGLRCFHRYVAVVGGKGGGGMREEPISVFLREGVS
jgi:hypothetical protein